jgi:hypothetical protein
MVAALAVRLPVGMSNFWVNTESIATLIRGSSA